MFIGPDRSRAYNPHRHGVPNHTLMLQVRGFKHAVVWPDDESPNLYQITDLLPKSNEIAEMPGIYQVDGINADVDKQPDLTKVKTSWEGVAGPGDLLFIPCGIPHTVENRGESVALGWFPSGDDMRMQTMDATTPYDGPMQCPNANAVGYDCVSESAESEAGAMSEKHFHLRVFRCSAKDKRV